MFPFRLVCGALSGTLLVLALPKPDFHVLGWIALVPLLLVLNGTERYLRTFLVGYVTGLAFFGGTCYWIVNTMNTYGGLPFGVSVAVFALFVAVFAAHTAVFAILMRMGIGRWGNRALWLAPPVWVAIELAQAHLIFGGFPWMLSGYALAPYGGLLQIVTWTGVYGLSFVLLTVNALVAFAIRTRHWQTGVAAAGVIAVAMMLPVPSDPLPEVQDPLDVRIVQTNIPIDFPWGGAEEESLLDELTMLSRRGDPDAPPPDLLVWPETPGPFLLGQDSPFSRRIGALARMLDTYVLVGYIDFSGGMPTNSAGLVSPGGEQVSRYDKIHLVPFGEYVPLGNILFFAESLVRNVGDFAPGTEYTVSTLGTHRIATTICYEDVFPGLMRQFTRRGAELIVNISNDGWFGSSSAPYQHLRMAVVRAVESRRWLVRATNTGISAIIDPYGTVVGQTGLGERTTFDGVAGYRTGTTVYVRYGDVFAFAATLAALAFVSVALVNPGNRATSGGRR